ncbi:MAG: hypothetical protein KR126chlam2_01339, partial [Chlamydiae bacterium]|nr:hypothetical protein [Chlamydiota bacterium]
DYLLRDIAPAKKCNVNIDLVTAMGTKSVDFIFGGFWNIEPAQLRSLGVETGYFEFKEFGVPNYYEMIILANDHSPQSEPDFINRFQRALQKSIDFCKTHPLEAFQAYLQSNPDKRRKTITWELEAWETTYPLLADNQTIELEVLDPFYHWLADEGFVSKPFDFQSLISHQPQT